MGRCDTNCTRTTETNVGIAAGLATAGNATKKPWINPAPRWWMTQRPRPCMGATYDNLRRASIVPWGADHRKAIGSRDVGRAVRIHAGRACPPQYVPPAPQAHNAAA